MKYKVGLLVIATGNYIELLKPFIDSAKTFFLNDHDVQVFVFTDNETLNPDKEMITKCMIDHEPWPFVTLKRFNYFHTYQDQLKDKDFLYYIDVDSRFVAKVGEEILPIKEKGLVGVDHPGFCLMPRIYKYFYKFFSRIGIGFLFLKRKRGTYDTNPKSTACVKDDEGEVYYCGGLIGGSADHFLIMTESLRKNIQEDTNNNVMALWHDESHLNRYFIDNPPVITLSPSYCYPEKSNLPFKRKILALDKDHKKIRGQ